MIESGGGGEREREREKAPPAQASVSEGAQVGPGAPPERPSVPPPRKSNGSRKPRINGEVRLDAKLQRLARSVGRNKLVPDVTALEKHYSRSIRIRRKILEFLKLKEGSMYRETSDLDGAAANYADCNEETAHRWIHQFTSEGGSHRWVDATDYWILEARDGP